MASTDGRFVSLHDQRFSAVTVRTGPDMLDGLLRCRDCRKRVRGCWPARCPKALDCYVSMSVFFFLRLHVKLNGRLRTR